MEVKVLGVVIGIADGWDEADEFCLQFYDFVSNIDDIGNAECLYVDPWNGEIKSFGGGGEILWKHNLLDVLKSL